MYLYRSMEGDPISRRSFLKGAGVLATAGVLSACSPNLPEAMLTPEVENIEKKKILTNIQPVVVSVPQESLGAIDPRDPGRNYPRAIKEGGILNVGGAVLRMTYKGGVFADTDVTFLHQPQDGERLGVGDILPSMYIFTQGEEKNVVTLHNLVMPLQGMKSREVNLEQNSTYCLLPIVTVGVSTDIKDYGNTVPRGFIINSDNMLGSDSGYLSWALLQTAKEKNEDGTWGVQMMGIIENTSNRGIFLNDEYPDMSKYDIGE